MCTARALKTLIDKANHKPPVLSYAHSLGSGPTRPISMSNEKRPGICSREDTRISDVAVSQASRRLALKAEIDPQLKKLIQRVESALGVCQVLRPDPLVPLFKIFARIS